MLESSGDLWCAGAANFPLYHLDFQHLPGMMVRASVATKRGANALNGLARAHFDLMIPFTSTEALCLCKIHIRLKAQKVTPAPKWREAEPEIYLHS